MAILNVTPDSFFFAGSRMPDACRTPREGGRREGAFDYRRGRLFVAPGVDEVPADEEWRRVELGIAVRRWRLAS